jgi:hypothetical protein
MKRLATTASAIGLFALILVVSKTPLLASSLLSGSGRFTIATARARCNGEKPIVQLTWRPSANATTYRVERKPSIGGTWSTVSPVLRRLTTFTDSSLAKMGRYRYRIVTSDGTREVRSNTKVVVVRPCAARDTKLWGAYVGWEEEEGPAFEQRIGKSMNLRATFVHWGNEREFPSYLKDSMREKTLVIFWEAFDYNTEGPDQPAYSYEAISRGDWDSYIKTFAADAKAYGEPVILVPFEEMNGDWYPSSGTKNGNTPAKHIAAYRHLREFFRNAPNVQFGWAVNSDSVPDTPENRIAAYYPGDAYVDVVGVDGFNFGEPWKSFDEIFGQALTELSTYNKPLYIFSMASAEGPHKAAWIADTLSSIARNPSITGWIWFNEDKEHDWRVWSDEAALKAFTKNLPR